MFDIDLEEEERVDEVPQVQNPEPIPGRRNEA
jgi:hypothetical protein